MDRDTTTDLPGRTGAGADAAPPALRLRAVSKTFGGVRALRSVDFEVRQGEVHCLAGENGCGKSTLIKIVPGSMRPIPGRGSNCSANACRRSRRRAPGRWGWR